MPAGYQTRYPVSVQPESGLRETVVRLRFVLQPRHYHNDELRLRCTATFSKLLTLSSEETVLVASQQTSGFHIAENRSGRRAPGCGTLFWTALEAVFVFFLLR